MVLDEARGLIYLPTTTPSSDYYGGNRPGANLFAESLVCLDANTGKMKWYFQAVHHGLWDWDFPAPPTLVTITVDGQKIDAVAQVSKQGFTYVFDRVTGKPVWPIVERPVPTETDVPGEKPFATQPFPTKPPPFVDQGVTLEDANNLTPEIQSAGAGADEEVQARSDLHAAVARRHAAAAIGRRRRELGRRVVRSGDRLPVRARGSHSLGVNRVAKNDGSDPLVKVDYSNMFARAGGGGDGDAPGRAAVDLAALRVLTAYRLEQGRDRLEGAAWRGQPARSATTRC